MWSSYIKGSRDCPKLVEVIKCSAPACSNAPSPCAGDPQRPHHPWTDRPPSACRRRRYQCRAPAPADARLDAGMRLWTARWRIIRRSQPRFGFVRHAPTCGQCLRRGRGVGRGSHRRAALSIINVEKRSIQLLGIGSVVDGVGNQQLCEAITRGHDHTRHTLARIITVRFAIDSRWESNLVCAH